MTEIAGQKIWADESDIHGLRPESVTIQLFADGAPVDATPTWTSTTGNVWSYSFGMLPAVTTTGIEIHYTVSELPVEGYEAAVSGFIITNKLIPQQPKAYTEFAGVKTWNDQNNAKGKRPTNITVHLLRDGEVVETRVVTAATEWKYTFGTQPLDDGYGKTYTYEVREDAVKGYFVRVDGNNVINTALDVTTPQAPSGEDSISTGETSVSRILTNKGINTAGLTVREQIPSRDTGTPAPGFGDYTEEELGELFDLFGYGTPLFGMLGTGDETPAYPYVFGGVGALALIALIVFSKKRRKA